MLAVPSLLTQSFLIVSSPYLAACPPCLPASSTPHASRPPASTCKRAPFALVHLVGRCLAQAGLQVAAPQPAKPTCTRSNRHTLLHKTKAQLPAAPPSSIAQLKPPRPCMLPTVPTCSTAFVVKSKAEAMLPVASHHPMVCSLHPGGCGCGGVSGRAHVCAYESMHPYVQACACVRVCLCCALINASTRELIHGRPLACPQPPTPNQQPAADLGALQGMPHLWRSWSKQSTLSL